MYILNDPKIRNKPVWYCWLFLNGHIKKSLEESEFMLTMDHHKVEHIVSKKQLSRDPRDLSSTALIDMTMAYSILSDISRMCKLEKPFRLSYSDLKTIFGCIDKIDVSLTIIESFIDNGAI